MSAITTAADNFYAIRLSRLIQLDFTDWSAYEEGIIDDKGKVIKKPSSPSERASWTKFHVIARNLKRMMATVPGGNSALRYGLGYVLLTKSQAARQAGQSHSLVPRR